MSPSSSNRALNTPSPTPPVVKKSRSHSSIDELAKQDTRPPPARPHLSHDVSSSYQDPGPSNRKIHIISYPSAGSFDEGPVTASPGAWSLSASSDYSNSESAISRNHGDPKSGSLDSGGSSFSQNNYRALFGSQEGEARQSHFDVLTAHTEYGAPHNRDEARRSIASSTTFRDDGEDELHDPAQLTPMPSAYHPERLDVQPPRSHYPRRTASPSPSDTSVMLQSTPTRQSNSKNPSLTSSAYPSAKSGRLAFVAPPEVAASSIKALEKEVEAMRGSERIEMTVAGRPELPKGSLAVLGQARQEVVEDKKEEDEELYDRRRLPATTPPASGASVEAVMPNVRDGMLSPDKYERRIPSRTGSIELNGNLDARSPDLPARSKLRTQ